MNEANASSHSNHLEVSNTTISKHKQKWTSIVAKLRTCIREFYLPELVDENSEEALKEPLTAVSVSSLIMYLKEHFKRKVINYYPLSSTSGVDEMKFNFGILKSFIDEAIHEIQTQ